MHTYIRSARSSGRATNYFILNRKMPELFLDARTYRGSDIGSRHFLTLYDSDFHQNGYFYPKKTTRKGNILHYKILFLNDGSIRWPYERIKNMG